MGRTITTMTALAMLAISSCVPYARLPTRDASELAQAHFPGLETARLVIEQDHHVGDGQICNSQMYTGWREGHLAYVRFEDHCLGRSRLRHKYIEVIDMTRNGYANLWCTAHGRRPSLSSHLVRRANCNTLESRITMQTVQEELHQRVRDRL